MLVIRRSPEGYLRLHTATGHGALALLAVLMLLFQVGLVAGLRDEPIEVQIMLWMGALLVDLILVGALFAQRGIELRGDRILRFRRFFFTLSDEEPLADASLVILREVMSGTGKSRRLVYKVLLRADQEVELMMLYLPQDGRRAAEQIAKALKQSLLDETAGAVSLRAPDELDLPLKARLRQELTAPEAPPSGLHLEHTPNRLSVFVKPAVPKTLTLVLFLLLPFILVTVVLLAMAELTLYERLALGFAVSAVAAVGVGLSLRRSSWLSFVAASQIELDEAALTVRMTLGPLRRTVRFPLDELEELLALGDAHGVGLGLLARSDRASLAFAASLDPSQRDYLLDMLRFRIARLR